MRKLLFLFLLLTIFTTAGCGGTSYRNINSLNTQENHQITQLRHGYAKCILQTSFELDDGLIDPILLVKNGEQKCNSRISGIESFLHNHNFYPMQISDYVSAVRTTEARKSLEAILKIRTN